MFQKRERFIYFGAGIASSGTRDADPVLPCAWAILLYLLNCLGWSDARWRFPRIPGVRVCGFKSIHSLVGVHSSLSVCIAPQSHIESVDPWQFYFATRD